MTDNDRQELVQARYKVTTEDSQTLVMTRISKPGNSGKKPPIVLVHGLGQNRYTWHLSRVSFANYLACRGMDVFIPELRGHGLSRTIGGSQHPASFKEYVYMDVPAILRNVRELSGGQKTFYCGHSLGGTIAYALDPSEQEHLRGIVAIASPYHFAKGQILLTAGAKLLLAAHACTPLRAIDLLEKGTSFPVDLIGRLLVAVLPVYDTSLNLGPYRLWFPGTIDRDVLEERLFMGFDRTSLQVVRLMTIWAGRRRLLDEDRGGRYEKNLAAKTVPMLFLCGDKDDVVPAETVRGAYGLVTSKDRSWRVLNAAQHGTHWGHIDLTCGREAINHAWPLIAGWMEERE